MKAQAIRITRGGRRIRTRSFPCHENRPRRGETLRVLPNHAELVRDMLSYDVVGFQTEGDLRSFLSAVNHVFGSQCIAGDRSVCMGQRTIRCDVFPIGVDVDAIQTEAIDASNGPVVRKMIDGLLGASSSLVSIGSTTARGW